MATTKKVARKPPARERPRPGCIMVELSPEDRAKLLAVQAACTEARGMPVPISWTVRLAIREMWDILHRTGKIQDAEKSAVQS